MTPTPRRLPRPSRSPARRGPTRTPLALCAALCAGVLLARARPAHAIERPFTFASDARTPGQWNVDGLFRSTWGVSVGGAVRPIGAGALGLPGSVHELGAEVGLHPRIAVRGYGLLGLGFAPDQVYPTAGLEARARIVGDNTGPFQLTLAAGVLREFTGYAALQARVTASAQVWRVRLTADVVVERSFRPHADPIDLIAVAGASVLVVQGFRAGVEYVGQDFESAWEPGEVEGMRHLLGPSMAVQLLQQRFQVTGGVVFGLTPQSPVATVRLGAVYTF